MTNPADAKAVRERVQAIIDRDPDAFSNCLPKFMEAISEAAVFAFDPVAVCTVLEEISAEWVTPITRDMFLAARGRWFRSRAADGAHSYGYVPKVPGPAEEKEPPVWLDKGSDIYMKERFVGRNHKRLVYCKALKTWFAFNGLWWEQDDHDQAMRWAIETAEVVAKEYLAYANELEARAKEQVKDEEGMVNFKLSEADRIKMGKRAGGCRAAAKKMQSAKLINTFLTMAQADERCAVRPSVFDQHPQLVVVGNGVLDLSTGLLQDFDPELYLARGTTVPFTPNELDPQALEIWHQVLRHLATGIPYQKDKADKPKPGPNRDLLRFYQDLLGYCLYGHNELELFLLFWGEAGTGKGTFFEAIKETLGSDLAMTAEAKSFIQEKQYRPRDDLARLNGARMVLASEQDRGEQLAAAMINTIAGGDTTVSRFLYDKHKERRATYTVCLQVNHLPRVDWSDVGMRRRTKVVPMGRPVKDRDPAVKRILMDPTKGGPVILAWLIEGARRTYRIRRIEEPKVVKLVTGKYWAEQDRSWEFLSEVLRFAELGTPDWEKTYVLVDDMSGAYNEWCKRRHLPERYRLSAASLTSRLEEIGCAKKRTRRSIGDASVNRWWWFGVTITDGQGYMNKAQDGTHLPKQKESDDYLAKFRPIEDDLGTPWNTDGTPQAESAQDDTGSVPTFQENHENDASRVHARAREDSNSSNSFGTLEQKKKETENPEDLDGPQLPSLDDFDDEPFGA